MTDITPTEGPVERRARRTAVGLEYATVAWNLLEVMVAVVAGVAARSLGLVAFGLDSLVEVAASLVVIRHTQLPLAPSPRRLRRTLRAIAVCFVVLGGWLIVGAVVALVTGHAPASSPVGITFMAVTVAAMIGLARAKRNVGRKLGSEPVLANAAMTLLDGYVALGVCLALIADAVLGWWWADAAVAAAVGLAAIREGRLGWQRADC